MLSIIEKQLSFLRFRKLHPDQSNNNTDINDKNNNELSENQSNILFRTPE